MPEAQNSIMPVRRAERADIEALAELHAESFAEAWSEGFWVQKLTETSARLYVCPIETADAAEPLAGMLLARRIVDEAEILTLSVAITHRRQGVAKRLLDRLIADLCCDLPCRLFLEVSVENDAALALYANCGFTTVGTRKDYYRSANSVLVDAKVLALELRN